MNRLFVLLLAACWGGALQAQTVIHYREGERVEPEQVRQILEAPSSVRTRSIRLLADTPEKPASASPAALSLPVRFDFDSADILPSARPQLDALAEGIKLLPPGSRVVIEGHTDATGGDEYNLELSRQRAKAVKAYLVRVHGIEARRLRDVGAGKRDPIAGTDPFGAENRRVQFHGG